MGLRNRDIIPIRRRFDKRLSKHERFDRGFPRWYNETFLKTYIPKPPSHPMI